MVINQTIIDYLVIYAFSFVGIHYKWGGNNPLDGLDCSGLAVEILKASGIVKHNVDLSAQNIYDTMKVRIGSSSLASPQPGALAFFGSSETDINHIGFCVSDSLMIEAGGGNSTTLTKDDARVSNAFVKLRPVSYRRDLVGIILPSYL